MKKKKILCVPAYWIYGVLAMAVIGIIVGSFLDYQIDAAIANRTELGSYFANYSGYFAFMFPTTGGTCIYAALKDDPKWRKAGQGILLFGYTVSVLYCNNYAPTYIRELYGYVPGESSPLMSVWAFLFWMALNAGVSYLLMKVLDTDRKEELIRAGILFIAVAIIGFLMAEWLKFVGSRPRFKYLITLDDPMSEYRNWWEMIPYLAKRSQDELMSWPSAHMFRSGLTILLPVLSQVCKKQSSKRNMAMYAFSVVFMLLTTYNRLHMSNHFLSDVCWAMLLIVGVAAGMYCLLFDGVEKKTE